MQRIIALHHLMRHVTTDFGHRAIVFSRFPEIAMFHIVIASTQIAIGTIIMLAAILILLQSGRAPFFQQLAFCQYFFHGMVLQIAEWHRESTTGLKVAVRCNAE